MSEDALLRHRDEHLPKELAQAEQIAASTRADDLLEQLRKRQAQAEELVDIAKGLITRAVEQDDLRTATTAVQAAVSATRETRECLALLAKLRGDLDERATATVNVFASEWPALRYRLVQSLDDYPDARASVLSALASVDGQHNGRAH